MAGNILITLAVIAASLAAVQCMSKPNFCNSYDCPPFDSQRLNGFELRSYGETMWVGTSRVVSSTSSSSSTSSMFQKLYRYIGGANSAGKRIKMTVPVATKVQALGGGQFRYTMMFYVPGANPPTPNDSDVEIIAMPARDVYVSQYEKEADELRAALDSNDAVFDMSFYYQISYSSPYWPLRKHHEVWLDRN